MEGDGEEGVEGDGEEGVDRNGEEGVEGDGGGRSGVSTKVRVVQEWAPPLGAVP